MCETKIGLKVFGKKRFRFNVWFDLTWTGAKDGMNQEEQSCLTRIWAFHDIEFQDGHLPYQMRTVLAAAVRIQLLVDLPSSRYTMHNWAFRKKELFGAHLLYQRRTVLAAAVRIQLLVGLPS